MLIGHYVVLPFSAVMTAGLSSRDDDCTGIILTIVGAALHVPIVAWFIVAIWRRRRSALLDAFRQRIQKLRAVSTASTATLAALSDDLQVALPALPNANRQYTLFVRIAPDPSSSIVTEKLVSSRFRVSLRVKNVLACSKFDFRHSKAYQAIDYCWRRSPSKSDSTNKLWQIL